MAEVENGLAVVSEIPALSWMSFTATSTGLVVTGAPSVEEWNAYGGALKAIKEGIQWLLGDWMTYGEAAYGEQYAQALDATDYTSGALRNMKWCASNVAPEVRREDVPYSTHLEVAMMDDPKEQRKWLDRAAEMGWSRNELKHEIAGARHALAEQRGEQPPARDEYIADAVLTVAINVPQGDDAKAALLAALKGARFPYARNCEVWVTNVSLLDVNTAQEDSKQKSEQG
jgi:hypothetical protein